jgi:hypothetical protein
MSDVVANILRFEKPSQGVNILTFTSRDYIFDNYWDLATQHNDINVWLWTYNTLVYNPALLPKNVHILQTEELPLGINFDMIIAHDSKSMTVGRQLSNFLHVPLINWYHSSLPMFPSFASVSSFEGRGCMVMGGITEDQLPDRSEATDILCRGEFMDMVTMKTVPLSQNHYQRHLQYMSAKCLISFEHNDFVNEIDEAHMVGLPIISVQNHFHNGTCHQLGGTYGYKFEDIPTLLERVSREVGYNKKLVKRTKQDFVSDLLYLGGLTKGYCHAYL